VAFDELLAAARAQLGEPVRQGDREDLARDLLDAFAQDVIELRPRRLPLVTEVSARPSTTALVRHQIEHEGVQHPTNQRHEAMSIDRFESQLLRRLDGTRDAPTLSAAMVEATLKGDLEVKRDGDPLTDPVELRRLFDEAVPVKLGILCRKSFLIA
jgi:methyltransferase-like protein